MEETGIERARQTLGEIVDRARFTGEPTVITRQNKPVAVVVSVHAKVTLPDGSETTGLDLWRAAQEGGE